MLGLQTKMTSICHFCLAPPFGFEPLRHKKNRQKAVYFMAGVTGLEPATYGVTGRRSNQTELHPRNRNVYIDILCALQDFFLIPDIFLN